MKANISFSQQYATSELVGGLILVLIAIAVFSAIYIYVFPLPIPTSEPNVELLGYVNDEGLVVLEHIGGESLFAYKTTVRYLNGTLIKTETYENKKDPWEIGEYTHPIEDVYLLSEENKLHISVYKICNDGSEQTVFDGILKGKTEPPEPPLFPMLISSLRTNTVDEDLICFNYTIEPEIGAKTYIYNWSVDGNSIMNLLMPFDTNSSSTVKDYSGHMNNGSVFGPLWNSSGVVGGAYQFDGVDDYISLPYCFEGSFIDKITVEAWIKTNASSEVIASYDGDILWELGIRNDVLRWITNVNGDVADTIGITNVSDNSWHFVAASYDSITGESVIYVDGELDKIENEHDPGDQLGTGSTPAGSIGLGSKEKEEIIFSTGFETQDEKNSWSEHNETEGEEETWDTLTYDNFNSGWGSYTDGGGDCGRSSNYKHEGSHSAGVRDNSNTSSSFTITNGIDVDTPDYTSIKIDFWWMWRDYWNWGHPGWSNGEDWWIRYYDGNGWTTVIDRDYPSGYNEDTWYHEVLYINETDYDFPSNMRVRFQCDAGWDNDLVYFDEIYINASGSGRIDYEFDLWYSNDLEPRTGSYSLGGSGDFDPEYVAFNRTGIDISEYSDVNVSVWYSYKDTENADFFGLYYLDNDNLVPIFEVDNPDTGGSGQSPWTQAEVQIPDIIDSLVLQFNWTTSSTTEYVAIDDLEIKGVPLGGGNNFSGMIDEFRIYKHCLSAEQIYQNYLCTKDGESDRGIIVSEETNFGEQWKCTVTPNDGIQDDDFTISNILEIISYGGGG